ncbi:hypothetical protein [Escherichia coli]|uniref:hypothetical protein n=1 Tax=Escherichia coli TaxID=562 RepID=UPI0010CBF025|nr:hypothetical protein [Escherichia coli]
MTIVSILLLLTTGCVNPPSGKRVISQQQKMETSNSSDRLNDIEKIERCRRELEALKKIDLSIYNKRKEEFDKLISNALLYDEVRNNVGEYTQSTIDSLYKFRSDKLCSDIARDVLNKLSQ